MSLILGIIGTLVLFVVLMRLRLHVRNRSRHRATSDSWAVEAGSVKSESMGPSPTSAVRVGSSAGPKSEEHADLRVTVTSPLHEPRKINLSLFSSAATAIEARDGDNGLHPARSDRR
jgi:hypothetical protein